MVGVNGNVIIGDGYGNVDAFQITPSGTQSVLASGGGGNSSAAAMDAYGNVYIAYEYNGNVYKIPYDAVTGTYAGFTTAPSTNCAGGILDTAACVFAPNVQALSGIDGLAFDGQGNFIIATDTNGSTKNSIYVCSAACQAETDGHGTNAPAKLYTDSNNIGAIAADPWGNLYFADGSTSTGDVTNLNEIKFTAGSYAAPIVVESYTTAANNNGVSGITVGADGTVYFATNNDGIFGIPNSSSGLNLSGIFLVSNAAGGKAIAVDAHGNFVFVPYSNTLGEDVISILPTGSFQLAATAVGGTPATTTATVVDSGGSCTPSLTYAPTHFGVASSEYSASLTTGSSCSAALGTSNGTFSPAVSMTGSVTSATISFVPSAAGARNATLTITDAANNAVGAIALSGIGQGAIANLDPGAVAASLTTGLSGPASAVADPAGDLFVADAAAGKVVELPVGQTTLTTIGTGFTSPSALAFDANGNLFVADNGIPAIFEIPNVGTTKAFVAGTQSTLIGATMPIGGAVLKNPIGLAVGPRGTLYIADSTNARVVAINPQTGLGGVTGATSASGLVSPQGLAVDAASNLYVADPGAAKIFIFSNAGVESTIASVTGVTEPVGVAVDASGSAAHRRRGDGQYRSRSQPQRRSACGFQRHRH